MAAPSPHVLHPQVWAFFEQLLRAGKLPTGVLLTGPPGVGKGMLIRLLASRLLETDEPLRHPDVLRIEPQEDTKMRETLVQLLHQVHARPFRAAARVVLLPRVDLLHPDTAPLLLKTIEDAPPFAKILLTATTPGRVRATIRSRSLVREVPPLPEATLTGILRSANVADARAAELSRLAGGRPGLALRLDADEKLLERYRTWMRFLSNPDQPFRDRSALAAAVHASETAEEFLTFLQSHLRPGDEGSRIRCSPALLRRAREGMAMLRQYVPPQLIIEYVLNAS